MTTDHSVSDFWQIVQACLVEFYGFSEEAATQSMQSLWSRVEGTRVAPSPRDLIYHDQPKHVAIDLVGDAIPSQAVWDDYRQILKRYESQSKKSLDAKENAILSRKDAKSVRRVKPAAQQTALAAR